MKKQFFIYFLALLTLAACGNKSTIKNAVKPKTLAETYGDGKYIYREPFLAITDIQQYNSAVPDLGLLLSGIARTFMGIGLAASKNLGQAKMSLIQPVPSIPREYIKDIRLKRVFFYIEPKKNVERNCNKEFSLAYAKCLLQGRGNVDFNFLSKLAITVSPYHLKKRKSWVPNLNADEKLSKDMEKKYENIFKKKASIFPEVVNPRKAKELLIVKYDKSRKNSDGISEYIRNDDYGAMFIFKAQDPKKAITVRDFIETHELLKEQIENIYLLEDAIMVQLKKDRIVTETFIAVINSELDLLEEWEVDFEQCSPKTCLDLKLPNLSLIDIVAKDNAIKLDAFMEADDVPETFRLKGFIEFKMKFQAPF